MTRRNKPILIGYEKMKEKQKEKRKMNEELKWFIQVSIIAFVLSIIFSFISNSAVSSLPLIPAILVLILVVFIGIIFDVIGVAVTVADEKEFHAKATKKLPGAKTSINLIKNAGKVSNICADVIGDICGVLSGAISAGIAIRIMNAMNISTNNQFIISALVASMTIGGKALGKGFARKHSTEIIMIIGKILSKFKKEK